MKQKSKEDIEDDALTAYFKSEEFSKNIAKIVEEDTWGKGRPKTYMDDSGNIVEHWKDGTINILMTKEEIDARQG